MVELILGAFCFGVLAGTFSGLLRSTEITEGGE